MNRFSYNDGYIKDKLKQMESLPLGDGNGDATEHTNFLNSLDEELMDLRMDRVILLFVLEDIIEDLEKTEWVNPEYVEWVKKEVSQVFERWNNDKQEIYKG